MELTTNIHQAFQLKPGMDSVKGKIESLDMVNNLFCYGDSKGNIQLCQADISETKFNLQEIITKKIKSKKIDSVLIMKNSKFVLCLCDGSLFLLEPMTLEMRKNFTKNAAAYSVNNEEIIAVANGKKIQFFAIDAKISDFAPFTIGKSNEVSLPDSIEKISKINNE